MIRASIFISIATSSLLALELYCIQAASFKKESLINDLSFLKELELFLKSNKEARLEKINDIYTLRIGYYKGYSEAKVIREITNPKFPGSFVRHCIFNPDVRVDFYDEFFPNKKTEKKVVVNKEVITKEVVEKKSKIEEVTKKFNAKKLYRRGKKSFEEKNYKDAVDFYKKSLELNPNHSLTSLELARSYYRLKEYDKSKRIFIKLQKSALPKSVLANIKKFLQLIALSKESETLKESATISFGAMGGVYYDSNVNTSSNIENYYIPLFNIFAQNDTTKVSDTYFQNAIFFKYNKQLSDNVFYENSNMLFAQNYSSYTNNNSALASMSNTIGVTIDNVSLSFPLTVSRFMFGSDSLFNSADVATKANFIVNNRLRISTDLTLGTKRYVKNVDKDRNSNSISLGLRTNYVLDATNYLSASLGYIDESENKKTERTDVNNATFLFLLNYTKILNEYMLNSSYSYRDIKYSEVDKALLTKRDDKNENISLSISRKIPFDVLLNVSYSHTKNRSNQAPFTYDKNVYGINLNKEF